MPTIYLSYILGITPVFKRGSQSDPTCYHLIGALPTLSRIFEQLLVPQLWWHIDPYIPHEQFSFMRGPVVWLLVYPLLLLSLQLLTNVLRLWISKEHSTVSVGKALWLIFGVLVFRIRSLERFNHIFIQPIYTSCYSIWLFGLTLCYCWSPPGNSMVSCPI